MQLLQIHWKGHMGHVGDQWIIPIALLVVLFAYDV